MAREATVVPALLPCLSAAWAPRRGTDIVLFCLHAFEALPWKWLPALEPGPHSKGTGLGIICFVQVSCRDWASPHPATSVFAGQHGAQWPRVLKLVAFPAWAVEPVAVLAWGPSGCHCGLWCASTVGVWPRPHVFRYLFSVLPLHASIPGSVNGPVWGPL